MYDPDLDQWTAKADMISERSDHVTLACNGKIYVLGGDGNAIAGTASEVYDPEEDSWTQIAPMPYGVFDAGGCVINNEIYLFGGRKVIDQVSQSSRILKYNPDKDQWSIYGYMPAANTEHTVCAFEGKVYLFGGYKMATLSTGHNYSLVSEHVYEFELSDLELNETFQDTVFGNGEEFSLDLSKHFSHKNGEQISYTVCTSKDEVVSDSLDGHMLFLKGLNAGTVQVHVRAESGSDESGDQFTVELTPGVSVQEAAGNLFQLFPNPAVDQLTIKLLQEGPHDYQIYTASGQQVLHGIIKASTPVIDLSALDQGLYFIKVGSAKRTVTRKFLILR